MNADRHDSPFSLPRTRGSVFYAQFGCLLLEQGLDPNTFNDPFSARLVRVFCKSMALFSVISLFYSYTRLYFLCFIKENCLFSICEGLLSTSPKVFFMSKTPLSMSNIDVLLNSKATFIIFLHIHHVQ